LNDKVRLYAKIGSALITAKAAQTDPFAAIANTVDWSGPYSPSNGFVIRRSGAG
jgi:hypothetical protein